MKKSLMQKEQGFCLKVLLTLRQKPCPRITYNLFYSDYFFLYNVYHFVHNSYNNLLLFLLFLDNCNLPLQLFCSCVNACTYELANTMPNNSKIKIIQEIITLFFMRSSPPLNLEYFFIYYIILLGKIYRFCVFF